MAFDFPASPTLGQTFTPQAGTTYAWNGYGWVLQTSMGLIISDTPPTGAFNGQMWWESDTGRLYFYYNDGTSSQWVAVGGGGIAPIPGPQNNLINGKLVESHVSNAATFAIKTSAGTDPNVANPVSVIFTDGSILTITSPVSLTMPDQAMPGSSVPTRLWFALANDGGTPRLVVRRCQTTGIIQGFDPRGILSATTPPASGSCVNYSNANITNRPYRIIAFADYETALPSSKSWTTSPTFITMVGPNTHLPGTAVQIVNNTVSGGTLCSSGSWVGTNLVQAITPLSLINGIMVECFADHHFNAAASTDVLYASMSRNGTLIGSQQYDWTWAATTYWGGVMYSQKQMDFPFLASSINYQLYGHLNTSSANYYYLPYGGGSLTLNEIMG